MSDGTGSPVHPDLRKSVFAQYILDAPFLSDMVNCSVCGERLADDVRFLNHMMEKHGFRNPNVGKPDRNSRGY